MKQTGNISFQAYFFSLHHNAFFCVKEAEEKYQAADHTEDDHYNTETKSFISISKFIYKS